MRRNASPLVAPQTHRQEKLPMKRLRIIGLMLLALLSLGAFAASMASAEEGVLPTEGFTGKGTAQTLETLSVEGKESEKIACTAVSILEGVFTNDKEGTANLHFTGCTATALKVAVNSLGDEPKVILEKVNFTICLVEPKTLVFGIAITGAKDPVHIEVPAVKSLILVKGTVIAELEGAGLKGKAFKYKLSGEKGDQKFALKCEIEGKKFEHTYAAAKDSEAKDEHASQNGLFTLEFKNEVALMDT
jgi:hypothetical protein